MEQWNKRDRYLSPQQRIVEAMELSDLSVSIALAAIRAQQPGADEQTVLRTYTCRALADEPRRSQP